MLWPQGKKQDTLNSIIPCFLTDHSITAFFESWNIGGELFAQEKERRRTARQSEPTRINGKAWGYEIKEKNGLERPKQR
jgi:hypothetical protein